MTRESSVAKFMRQEMSCTNSKCLLDEKRTLNTMRIKSVLFIALALLVVPFGTMAQDTPSTADHPLISRYSGQVLDGYEFQEFDEAVYTDIVRRFENGETS